MLPKVVLFMLVGLLCICFIEAVVQNQMKVEAAKPNYDFLVPLGEVTTPLAYGGPLVLDKRTGAVWLFYINPDSPKPAGVEALYCGEIGELMLGKFR